MQNLFKLILALLPPKASIQLRYFYKFHKFVNFRNPKSFTEKIQWLKLYNYHPEYTTMVDKYAVKKYVADIIGEEYIIPTLGVWDNPQDIDWDKLPEKFVLKTTHAGGSNGVIICNDSKTFDKLGAVNKLKESLSTDSYAVSKERPYKKVPRKIIAEEYITNGIDRNLPDYKWYCFNGEPVYCQVIRDRNINETIDFYDKNWSHQEFIGLNPTVNNGKTPVPQPKSISKQIEIARKLSEGIPFVRVDLYEVDDKTYFGELTFFPASGMGNFTPEQWNEKIGNLLRLPSQGGVYDIDYQ